MSVSTYHVTYLYVFDSSRLGLLARPSQERRSSGRYPGHPPVALGRLRRVRHLVFCTGHPHGHALLPTLQERFASRPEDPGWPSFQVSSHILLASKCSSHSLLLHREYLDMDVTVTNEKVHEVADLSAAKLNATLLELRRLFLVEDIVDSIKFGLVLWALTYVGAWFNGLTLVILGKIIVDNCLSMATNESFATRGHWSLHVAQSLRNSPGEDRPEPRHGSRQNQRNRWKVISRNSKQFGSRKETNDHLAFF